MNTQRRFRSIRVLVTILTWLVLVLLTLWAVAALAVDVRVGWLRLPLAVLYVPVLGVLMFRFGRLGPSSLHTGRYALEGSHDH